MSHNQIIGKSDSLASSEASVRSDSSAPSKDVLRFKLPPDINIESMPSRLSLPSRVGVLE